jgi:hypothetical protein
MDKNGPAMHGQSGNSDVRRSDRLTELFKEVDPIEITDIDFRGKTPQEIVYFLPKFTEMQAGSANPAFGILMDPATGRAWGLRSGLSPLTVETIKGIRYRCGTMTNEVVTAAGGAWFGAEVPLGAHVEGQAAAFMRKMSITKAVLYINAGTPCKQDGVGCFYQLPEMLAEGATLLVYNKRGRPFSYTGEKD